MNIFVSPLAFNSLLCSGGRENFAYEDIVYFYFYFSDTKYLTPRQWNPNSPSSFGAIFLDYASKQSGFLGRDWYVSKPSWNKCRADTSFFYIYQHLKKKNPLLSSDYFCCCSGTPSMFSFLFSPSILPSLPLSLRQVLATVSSCWSRTH